MARVYKGKTRFISFSEIMLLATAAVSKKKWYILEEVFAALFVHCFALAQMMLLIHVSYLKKNFIFSSTTKHALYNLSNYVDCSAIITLSYLSNVNLFLCWGGQEINVLEMNKNILQFIP